MRYKPRSFLLLAAWLALAGTVHPLAAQEPNASKAAWHLRLLPGDVRAGERARVEVSATIAAPWHIYAPTTPSGGPIATVISLDLKKAPGWRSAGRLTEPRFKRYKDEGFGIFVETYEGKASFTLPVQIASTAPSRGQVTVSVLYQACNAHSCLPPETVIESLPYQLQPGKARAARLQLPAAPGDSSPPAPAPSAPLRAALAPDGSSDGGGLLAFLLLAAGSGLAALVTPCVFPMIPITVSFFTKQQENGGGGLIGPIAYCLGIVSTFTLVGIAVSALFGATGITRFAANPWLNLAMAALFTLLAFNLFGSFDIAVPSRFIPKTAGVRTSSWTARVVQPVLMGLVFSLTSFTCTVPFVGTALVAAASGPAFRPVLGMLAFSAAFACPFFLLALFPSWLKRLPRSGQWLVSVKAFLGFVELAAALKFVQQADYTWQLGLMTRTVFLATWALIAALAALYLWRILRWPREEGAAPLGPGRRTLGGAMLVLAVYLLSVTRSGSLADFDAYLPEAAYGATRAAPSAWVKDDYPLAQQLAAEQDKPVLINFTGYACTNCRLMEQHVLPNALVTGGLSRFVPVELHTDGPDAASRRNSALQQRLLHTVAIPTYAVLTPNGKLIARLDGLQRDPATFAAWMQRALSAVRVTSGNKGG